MADNYVMGAGRLYFAPEDAQGNALDERYLGNTQGFEVSVETEVVEFFSSDGPTAELVDQANIRATRNSTINADNIDDANLSLFFQADQATVTGYVGLVDGLRTRVQHTALPLAARCYGQPVDEHVAMVLAWWQHAVDEAHGAEDLDPVIPHGD